MREAWLTGMATVSAMATMLAMWTAAIGPVRAQCWEGVGVRSGRGDVTAMLEVAAGRCEMTTVLATG